jgi:Holliday junction resolvase
MSRAQRDKGARRERQVVALHHALGVPAERIPLSGATRYQGNGADVDIYALGAERPALAAEVKARASGAGFATLERWLDEADIMFLIRDRADPLVVLPWATWANILQHINGGKDGRGNEG